MPRGTITSVWWSTVFGYVMLCAFILIIPDMNGAAKQGWNVFFWAMDSQLPAGIKTALYAAITIPQFLCGLATVTSISRMMFAFSRDGGLPFSKLLASVSVKHRTPVHSIWAGSILSFLFVWGAKLRAGGRWNAGLHGGGVVHRDLPVLLLRDPDCLGPVRARHL